MIQALFGRKWRFLSNLPKLTALQEKVKSYTEHKNVEIADKIKKEVKGKDEISLLSFQIANMIRELEKHIKEVFVIGNSYRIGGDEFSVILTNDSHCTEDLCKLFSEKLEQDTSETPWQHVSAAISFSFYYK